MTTPFAPVELGHFNTEVQAIYRLAEREASMLGHPKTESDHVLAGAIVHRHNVAAEILDSLGLTFSKLGEIREQMRTLHHHRISFDGLAVDDVRPSLEALQLLQLARLIMIRENPATSEKRLGNITHLMKAILMAQSNNPLMKRLLYSQGHPSRQVRPAMEILAINHIDIGRLAEALDAEAHKWD